VGRVNKNKKMIFLKYNLQKVKRILFLFFFITCGYSSFSQDTLYYKDGKIDVVNLRYKTKNSITFNEYPDGIISNVIGTTELIKIVTSYGEQIIYSRVGETSSNEKSNITNFQTPKNNNITFQFVKCQEANINLGKDVILLKTGEEINSKILNVSIKEISYKKSDFLDGPTYTIDPTTVFMITYSNGNKDIVKQEGNISETSISEGLTDAEIVMQAKSDAYYNFSGIGPFFAGFSSILLSPLFALIPAAIVSSNEPNESKLNCPNQELFNKNLQYQNAYRKEAHKIKKKNVWAGYGVGAFINTFVALIIIYR
jgi:hypothetical protein